MLEIVQQHNAFACFCSFAITDCLTCSGLRILKSKESMSAEKIAMFCLPR